jgi:hypothetical protein
MMMIYYYVGYYILYFTISFFKKIEINNYIHIHTTYPTNLSKQSIYSIYYLLVKLFCKIK